MFGLTIEPQPMKMARRKLVASLMYFWSKPAPKLTTAIPVPEAAEIVPLSPGESLGQVRHARALGRSRISRCLPLGTDKTQVVNRLRVFVLLGAALAFSMEPLVGRLLMVDALSATFDEVRVPQRNRIGEEGHGFIYQMQQFQEERLWAAASCLQSLTNCIRWTVEWAQERKLFGATLADQQWVQFKLAELKTEVEALRALTYRACDLYVQGQDVLELASMAKLKAGRLNREVPDTCLQFWGGMGFTWENKVSRMYRDGRLASIGGGADEVMLGILAKIMGIAKRPVDTPSPSGRGRG